MSGRYPTSPSYPATAPVVLDGRYELGETIAEGGMARVHYGRDLKLKREVAIKVLRAHFASSPEFLSRFHREAEMAAQHAHSNLVNVYDVGQDGGMHYIVMELLPGRTLKDLTASGPLPLEEAVELMRQVATGMAFAHRRGMVHRDLKPQNILMTEAGNAKVADFGLALTGESSQLTQPGTVWGTVQYLSPEQAQGLPANARSDIYSLGAIFFELLTGQPPFEGATPASIMMKHVYNPPPDASEINPSVPVAAARVAQRALAKSADERFQTMEEFGQALAAVRDAATAETSVWGAVPAPTGARRPGQTVGPEDETRVFIPPPAQPVRPGRTGQGGQTGQSGQPGWRPDGLEAPVTQPLRRPVPPSEQRRLRDTKPRNRRLPLILAGALLLFFALMAVGAALASQLVRYQPVTAPRPTATVAPVATPTTAPTPSPTVVMVQVPNVTGDPLPTAQAKLGGVSLTAEVTEEFSKDVPRGAVAAQDPVVNTRIEQGKAVRLTVSRGPQTVAVPNTVGKSFEDARADLSGAGFTVRRENAFSTRTVGQVAEQRPAANAQADPGSEVVLVVSQGPREVTMPRLRGVPLVEALRVLRELGLEVDVREVSDSTVEPGTVSTTDPDAEKPAARDRRVIVAVAARPAATATAVPPSPTATRPAATATAPAAPAAAATSTVAGPSPTARPAGTPQAQPTAATNPAGQTPPGQQGR